MTELSLNLVSRKIENPDGDIIFLHGLGSNSISAWTPETTVGKGENEREIISYFPAVIAADYPTCNVWALDYSAMVSDWSDSSKFRELPRYCSNILNYLSGMGIGNRKIVLVCHSLGGIVAKEMLRISHNSKYSRLKAVFDKTAAISFIATPHKGSSWADVLSCVNSVIPFLRASVRIEELAHDNVYLEQLGDWYRQVSADGEVETQAFYELKKTKGAMIVPHYSANPDVGGCFPIGINRNHVEICKPSKKADEVYVSLCGLLNYHIMGAKSVRGLETPQNSIPPQTVVIGIIRRGSKVLMVRRRNPIDNLTWQFVAGRLKVGQESAEECIIREVKEETGILAKVSSRLGESIDSVTPYKKIYYALDYLDGEAENKDAVENSDVRWVKVENIEQFVTTKIDERVRKYLGL